MSLPRLDIAFIAYKFGREYGGAEAYGVELMKELSKRHNITVIAREYSASCDLKLPFIPIHLANFWPSWVRSYLFAKQSAQITAQHNYHLVHSHMNGWNGDLDVLHVKSVRYHWVTRQRSRLKKMTHAISPRINMYLWLEKQRIHTKPPKRTVAVSELLKQQLQQAYKTNYPFDVITPGVHLPLLSPALRKETRQKLGFIDGDMVCIQVARNPLNKGLKTILAALAVLPAHLKLLVIGVPESLSVQLETELAQTKLTQRVTLIGQTEDISAYYQAADLCLHPTFNDSFGMAPLEAMSYRLPVIMSRGHYCGFAHYATHNENALLLNDPHNALALQQAIERLLCETELVSSLQENAYLLAQKFSWENIAKQFESIYIDILATRIQQGKISPITFAQQTSTT